MSDLVLLLVFLWQSDVEMGSEEPNHELGDVSFDELDLVQVYEASIKFLNENVVQTTNADKLRLYGYFKVVTNGPCRAAEPDTSDIVGLTKWRAWKTTSHLSRNAAMRGYIRVVDTVVPGWRKIEFGEFPSSQVPVAKVEDAESSLFRVRKGDLFLLQNTGGVSTWRPRHCVLDGMVLSVYMSSQREKSPHEVMYLQGCSVILDKASTSACLGKRSLFSFTILHDSSGKEHRLASLNLRDAKEWVDEIRSVLEEGNDELLWHPAADVLSKYDPFQIELAEQLHINRLIEEYANVEVEATEDESDPEMDEETPLEWIDEARSFDFPVRMAPVIRNGLSCLMEHIYSFRASPKWVPNFEEAGVKCYASTNYLRGPPAALGETIISAPAMTILDAAWDPANRKEFDPLLEEIQTIESFGSQTRIDHLVYKAVWPTTAREFCNLSHWRILEDGETIVVSSSSVNDKRCTKKPGTIRARILGSALVIKPITERKCEVLYYIQSEPMGSVPSVFIRKVQGKRPMMLRELRSFVQARFLERKGGVIPGISALLKPSLSGRRKVGFVARNEMAEDDAPVQARRRMTIPQSMHLNRKRKRVTRPVKVRLASYRSLELVGLMMLLVILFRLDKTTDIFEGVLTFIGTISFGLLILVGNPFADSISFRKDQDVFSRLFRSESSFDERILIRRNVEIPNLDRSAVELQLMNTAAVALRASSPRTRAHLRFGYYESLNEIVVSARVNHSSFIRVTHHNENISKEVLNDDEPNFLGRLLPLPVARLICRLGHEVPGVLPRYPFGNACVVFGPTLPTKCDRGFLGTWANCTLELWIDGFSTNKASIAARVDLRFCESRDEAQKLVNHIAELVEREFSSHV